MSEIIRFYAKGLNRTWHSQLNCSKDPLYDNHRKIPNMPNSLPHREKMAQNRKKLICLDEKGIDGTKSTTTDND